MFLLLQSPPLCGILRGLRRRTRNLFLGSESQRYRNRATTTGSLPQPTTAQYDKCKMPYCFILVQQAFASRQSRQEALRLCVLELMLCVSCARLRPKDTR